MANQQSGATFRTPGADGSYDTGLAEWRTLTGRVQLPLNDAEWRKTQVPWHRPGECYWASDAKALARRWEHRSVQSPLCHLQLAGLLRNTNTKTQVLLSN